MSEPLALLRGLTALTVLNARDVLEQGLAAIKAGPAVLDLGAVTNVDSCAVAVILAWRRAAQQSGSSLKLKNLPKNLASLTSLYGVCQILFDASDESAAPDASTVAN